MLGVSGPRLWAGTVVLLDPVIIDTVEGSSVSFTGSTAARIVLRVPHRARKAKPPDLVMGDEIMFFPYERNETFLGRVVGFKGGLAILERPGEEYGLQLALDIPIYILTWPPRTAWERLGAGVDTW